jgi:zinc transporter ZupT
MTDQTLNEQNLLPERKKPFSLPVAGLLVLPLILLGGVILLFLTTGGGLHLSSPVPIENLATERTVLSPGRIEIQVRNTSPHEIIIAQAIINDAVWPVTVSPSPTIPRLGKATVHFEYPWSEGEAYGITLFSSNAIPFAVDIPAAVETSQPDGKTFLSYTLVGVYVGIIPVYLGLVWFPVLRKLGRKWMTFLLAITAGLLIFLALDTLVEALEQAVNVPGPFQGIGLVGIGAVGTFFLLDAITRRQVATGKDDVSKRLTLATMIALGIGLHNLGEGLAIGAAYNIGEIALGAFLVTGFIIQNITEGLGIIAPILRDQPGLRTLVLLGLLGGAPAILGAWIGGFAPSPTLAVLFLAIGTGAVFEVVYEILKMIHKDTQQNPMPVTVFSGVMVGMLILWVTGLLIK